MVSDGSMWQILRTISMPFGPGLTRFNVASSYSLGDKGRVELR